MWYIQDYADFMAMLQRLDLPKDKSTYESATDDTYKLETAVNGH